MYCQRCGAKVEENQKFCNKCGNNLTVSQISSQNINSLRVNKKMIFVGTGIGISILTIIIACILVFSKQSQDYYSINIYENYEEKDEEQSKTAEIKKDEKKSKTGKYRTVIITDNTYSGVKIRNASDAYDLIIEDSIGQKETTPKEIKSIEESIINKYGITAVNFAELDTEFAKEIVNVLDEIYNEYPSIRGHLTNISLTNSTMSEDYIAAFMPIFQFATSDTDLTYPWVIKTQVVLNSRYFLNPERLKISVTDGADSGHFPPNATIYSPIAHEFGHYLSFLAMIKQYNTDSILLIDANNLNDLFAIQEDFSEGSFSLKMIEEAYKNYKNDTNTKLTIDEWRATISNYAITKDNSGNYIYDETIAESFHDVYLNKENAQDASKYIVSVLKKYLES